MFNFYVYRNVCGNRKSSVNKALINFSRLLGCGFKLKFKQKYNCLWRAYNFDLFPWLGGNGAQKSTRVLIAVRCPESNRTSVHFNNNAKIRRTNRIAAADRGTKKNYKFPINAPRSKVRRCPSTKAKREKIGKIKNYYANTYAEENIKMYLQCLVSI